MLLLYTFSNTVHSNTPSSPSDLTPTQSLYESVENIQLSAGIVDDVQLIQKLRELQVELSGMIRM